MTHHLSKDEAAIYDRQIRLWGIDAQQRIGQAHILIGGMRALTDEVCKNLALAGVASLTLIDHTTIVYEDLGAQFFLRESDIGKNRAEVAERSIKVLNPRVRVHVDKEDIALKTDAYFEQFDVVCLIHSDYTTMNRVDQIRRRVKKPFYYADAFGWFGCIFCDLTEHAYVIEKKIPPPKDSKAAPTVEKTAYVERYASLEDSLKKDWSYITPKAIKRRVPSLSFLIHILIKFQRDYNRLPNKSDIDMLLQQKSEYLTAMGVKDASVLGDDLIVNLCNLIDTELSPVAAIVGGILAQDILRTLSANELPIQNWFYYNGLDGTGLVQDV
ncbi:sumo-activating enzyme subunit 1 [Pilobolus umbonatus]|nr:sumo-activating enzyme subunit 1 [Pilobolus umbonatus]